MVFQNCRDTKFRSESARTASQLSYARSRANTLSGLTPIICGQLADSAVARDSFPLSEACVQHAICAWWPGPLVTQHGRASGDGLEAGAPARTPAADDVTSPGSTWPVLKLRTSAFEPLATCPRSIGAYGRDPTHSRPDAHPPRLGTQQISANITG